MVDDRPTSNPVELTSDRAEWVTLRVAAERVDRSIKTIRRALQAGKITGKRAGEGARAPWLVRMDTVSNHFAKSDVEAIGTGGVIPLSDYRIMQDRLQEAQAELMETKTRATAAETRLEYVKSDRDRARDEATEAAADMLKIRDELADAEHLAERWRDAGWRQRRRLRKAGE